MSSEPPPSRLIFFPALATDGRIFGPQRAAVPHLETPEWIPHIPGESLADYSHRFARTLNVTEPVVLGGVSLGGMVALEVARVVPTRCVILIASGRMARSISRISRAGERVLRILPDFFVDRLRRFVPWCLGRDGRLNHEHRRLLATMARAWPVPFLRWAARAACEWRGCAHPPQPGVPVFHIHGDRDDAFPVRRAKADRIVRRGNHVLNLSHPVEVNAFLAHHIGAFARRYKALG